MELQNKVAVITGGAGGIGQATAKLLVEKGAKVVLVDLNQQALDEATKNLNLAEEDVLTVAADVSKEEDVENYVRQTHNKFGRIDIFFNNAGIEGSFALIKDNPAENLEKVINVNIKGVFYGLKHVLPIMITQKSGSIINTSSVAGLVGFPGLAPYTASKHAVIGLTKAAALESATTGVQVNAICPAPINTRMMRAVEAGASPKDPTSVKEQFTRAIPMGRYGEADEIAHLVLFLGSDNSQFITGSAYRIDGGLVSQ